MPSISCLNCKFCSLQLFIKYKLIDHVRGWESENIDK